MVTPSFSRVTIKRIEHAAAAAEEEGVGLAERQSAPERRLEAHANVVHPAEQLARALDGEFSERLVGLSAGHPIEVVEKLVLRVRPGHGRRGAVVRTTQVARVARVAAAVKLGRPLENNDAAARARGRNRGAQRGVAAADHHHIVIFLEVHAPARSYFFIL